MDRPVAFALVAFVAVATCALILAERRGSRPGMWIAKPLASAGFVLLGVPPVDLALFAALVLSFLGDFFLLPTDPRLFRVGIVLFLLAHVAFIVAFVAMGIAWTWALAALVPLAIVALLVGRWILPTVSATLRPAVLAYIVVITAMVAVAAGAVAAGASPLLLVAAVAFFSNDILVARDRFVKKTWKNRLWGLPLYYGSMILFALFAAGSLP